jgi:hypothetical protein
MGRMRVLRGTHLGAWVGKTGAGGGCTVAARGRGALARNRACRKAGKRGKWGQRCSLPQPGAPVALAQRQKALERRRVGQLRCSGDRLARLGFARRGRRLRVEEIEGAGRQLYRAAEGASTWGLGAPHGRRRRRAAAGLGVEPESSSRSRTDPTGGAHLAVRERGRWERRVGLGRRGGDAAGPAGPRGGKEKGRLGWDLREEGKKGKKRWWAGWAAGKRKERREEKKEMGRAKIEREGEKEKHPNAFEFEI